jgi:hypothetical protein
VAIEKCSILFLKRFPAMMFLLIADIVDDLGKIGFAHTKPTVTVLPGKATQARGVLTEDLCRHKSNTRLTSLLSHMVQAALRASYAPTSITLF